MVADVKPGVIAPHRLTDAERDRRHALAEPRQHMQPCSDPPGQLHAIESIRVSGKLEDRYPAHMHMCGARLDPQETRIDCGQTRHLIILNPAAAEDHGQRATTQQPRVRHRARRPPSASHNLATGPRRPRPSRRVTSKVDTLRHQAALAGPSADARRPPAAMVTPRPSGT